MGFFKGHKGRRSYDLLSNYNHFMPNFTDLAWVVVLLLIGTFIGSLVLLPFMPLESMLTEYQATGTMETPGFVNDYGMLISYPLMFIPAMIYASVQSRRREGFTESYAIDNNNFGKHRGFTMAFVAAIMAIATSFILDPVSMLLPEMPEDMVKLMEQLLGGPTWVAFISVSIFAPFFEEWLCRGIVLRGLLKKVGPTWAIIISALFFAALHMNIWQGVSAFFMGLVFGYVYYKTGSLKLTMLMHFANNTLALILSKIPSLKDVDYFYEALSPWAYGGVYAVALIALVFGLILIKGIPQKEGNLGGCQKIDSIF